MKKTIILLTAALLVFICLVTTLHAAENKMGDIGIAADQKNAWVYLNGNRLGVTGEDGYFNVKVKKGEYHILIEKPIHNSPLAWSARHNVYVDDGASLRIKVNLKKQFASSEQVRISTHITAMANSIVMVAIPAGHFEMGSEKRKNEQPVHEVLIPAFKMSATEVTFEQYDIFAVETGRTSPDDQNWGRGSRPVINVSWDDAQAFVNWLNRTLKNEKPFRLPSEAEWEYAARAGSDSDYWWGDELGINKANCASCGSVWSNQKTAPVASYSANPFGLYDTVGNVWEWTADCWSENYEQAKNNASAWINDQCELKVLRGGSWYFNPRGVRSASRSFHHGDHSYSHYGFRLAQNF